MSSSPTDGSGTAPLGPHPSTPQPSTPQPSTPQPSTPQPSTPQPSTPQPSTPEAGTGGGSTLQPTSEGTRGTGATYARTSIPVELTNRAWREEALARATEIETLSRWISDLKPNLRGVDDEKADKHLVTAIEDHVQAVRSAAKTGGPAMRIGARLGRVASNLNAAEADLLRRAPSAYVCGEVPSLEAHVRRHLPVDDP